MLGFVKMSALSAFLSFGVVTAYEHSAGPRDEAKAVGLSEAKLFYDRIAPEGEIASSTLGRRQTPAGAVTTVGKGDRLASPAAKGCGEQTWPHVAPDCMTRADGLPYPGRIRVVTVGTREGSNTTVLRRLPQTDVASR
jgi:hypothetical protein